MFKVTSVLFLASAALLNATALAHQQPDDQPLATLGQPQARFLQVPHDEFNSTESSLLTDLTFGEDQNSDSTRTGLISRQLNLLRQTLVQIDLADCCPQWPNLTTLVAAGTSDEQSSRRRHSKGKDLMLRPGDLMQELKRTSTNITYLSIDGQPGESEREKYYNFYDNVHYYLRLLKVAKQILQSEDTSTNSDQTNQFNLTLMDADTRRAFKRNLNTIEFRSSRDPILSSFLVELREQMTNKSVRNMFDLYEDFILGTEFGQYYAHNISLIRDSVMIFNQVHSHLLLLDFQSNFTRPSKLYEMIRRMSYELYFIKNEITENTSIRIRTNREDVRRTLALLFDLAETRPYVRMLGDEFSSQPAYFSENVRKLTYLLDLYLTNSLTQLTFYDQLSELPQDFIILGSSIAHEYETKEVPRFTRFDSSHFSGLGVFSLARNEQPTATNTSNQEQADGRQSNLSILTRLFN